MSLVHDIQAAAISQSTDVPTLLRMCKLLAARISHAQFAEWVDRELNGYPNVESMPDYRVVPVDSYGAFVGSYGLRADRLQIPVSVLPEHVQGQYAYAYMGSSISAYSTLLDGDKTGSIREPWPIAAAVHHASAITPNMQCFSAWKEIPIGAVVRLMDSVKTRVLGFAIDLEREAPNAGDTPIGSLPPLSTEKMTQIFNTNISGNVANLSNLGENFSQTASAFVQRGDWMSLERQLTELGLKPADTEGMQTELEHVVHSGGADEQWKVAGSWIGRLAAKAATRAAGVGLEVAAASVAKAIAAYVGLPGA